MKDEQQVRIPVLIDCDPGIDDALAILLAEASPLLELRAITIVSGNMPAEQCALNAVNIKKLFHITAQIAKGGNSSDENLKDYRSSGFHGEYGMGFLKCQAGHEEISKKAAVELIYEEALRAGGELIIFATGPLSNIAAAATKYRELPRLVKKLIIMGGTTGKGNVNEFAEFNAWFDPAACDAVLSAGFNTYLVGLNATDQCALSRQELHKLLALCDETEKGLFLAELMEFIETKAFDENKETNIIYDAITVGTVLDEGLCRFETARVSCVKDLRAENRGQIIFEPISSREERNECFVAVCGNQHKFFTMMMNAFRILNAPC